MDDREAIVATLLQRHGRTFASEAGIRLGRNTPSALFQLLYTALLLSARIAARNATRAAHALIRSGLTTPRKMAATTWQQRVDVITWHGYKRYDERTATLLGECAERVLQRYQGDLRRLREEAGRDVAAESELLRGFKGIGTVGADIFLREVQLVWDEVHPYADERVLGAAAELGLPHEPAALARLVKRENFPRLSAALVRTGLERDYAEVRAAARG